MEQYLRAARPGEAEAVHALTAARVDWMDARGIHQWNDTDYLSVYPLAYYERNLPRLRVLAERGSEKILCAAVIFTGDPRWEPDAPALYIHNLVSALDAPGAGKTFLRLLEARAVKDGFAFLRLDSAEDNEALSAYYEVLGFLPRGACHEGSYRGILRQKQL